MVRALLAALVALLAAGCASAPRGARPGSAPWMPAIFADHMVLQCGMPVPMWGTDTPSTRVEVRYRGICIATAADATGFWSVVLPPLEPGGPDELRVEGSAVRVLRDVLAGEVWLCSGQSNMEWTVGLSDRPALVAARARDPLLRLFTVGKGGALSPRDDVRGYWTACVPEEAFDFSAVALAMGRELRAARRVPVGIVVSAWGGSRMECWLPREALAAHPHFARTLEQYADRLDANDLRDRRRRHAERVAEWLDGNLVPAPDAGTAAGWHRRGFDDSAWRSIAIPGRWETRLDLHIDGVAWMRRTVDIPPAWEGRDLVLSLGMVDDFDETWFDGERIGATDARTEFPSGARRIYRVPGRLAREGTATIALRATDIGWGGGMHGPREWFTIAPEDDPGAARPLAGDWRLAVETRVRTQPSPLPPPPEAPPDGPAVPTLAWNAMMAPLAPFAVRGFAWYQGEAHASEPWAMEEGLPLVVDSVRNAWQRELPVLVVQIAPFGAPANPRRSTTAELRAAQERAVDAIPAAGLVTIQDTANCADAHHRKGEAVGRRLAHAARGMVYGEAIPWRAPRLASAVFDGPDVGLQFSAAAGGLAVPPGQAPVGFMIAGPDRVFRTAHAEIVAPDVVLLRSDAVAAPVAVRYAWADCGAGNLADGAGIPVGPFRTDDWIDGVWMAWD